jgi:hypothetical protein
VSPEELALACRTSSRPFARPRQIPKKGGKGSRLIEAHHDGDLIESAHEVLAELLGALVPALTPVAFGVRGRTLEDALRPHLGRRWFVKIDIVDWYPSIRPRHVRHALLQELGEIDARLIGLLISRTHLPQGAKASPAAANLVLAGLDRAILAAARRGVRYTRYADDLFASGEDKAAVERLVVFIRHALRNMGFETTWQWDPPRSLGYSTKIGHLSRPKSERGLIRVAIHQLALSVDEPTEPARSIRGRIQHVANTNRAAARRLARSLETALRTRCIRATTRS